MNNRVTLVKLTREDITRKIQNYPSCMMVQTLVTKVYDFFFFHQCILFVA